MPNLKKKSKKVLIISTVIVVTFLIISFITFYSLGKFLSPQDKLEKSDVIITISGGDTLARTDEAINLYKSGWAPYLLFSGAARTGDVSNAESMRTRAIKKGVSSSKIFIEEDSTSTYENALFSKKIVQEHDWKKIILVTSPYHQRRAYMNFSFVLGREYRVINHSSGDKSWSADTWFSGNRNRGTSFDELSRVMYLIFTKKYSTEIK